MFTQVLTAQLKDGQVVHLKENLKKWTTTVGKRLSGCRSITTLSEDSGGNRIVILISFESAESLNALGDDSETLKIFDDSKELFTGVVQYFGANTETLDLK